MDICMFFFCIYSDALCIFYVSQVVRCCPVQTPPPHLLCTNPAGNPVLPHKHFIAYHKLIIIHFSFVPNRQASLLIILLAVDRLFIDKGIYKLLSKKIATSKFKLHLLVNIFSICCDCQDKIYICI